MIRFLVPLLSGVLTAGLVSAAPLTIDSFDQETELLQSGNSVSASTVSTNDGSFVGPTGTSKRTMEVTGHGDVPPDINYVLSQVGGGKYIFAAPEDASGGATLSYTSLSGLDLSNYLGFTFEDLKADHPFDYNVSITDTWGAPPSPPVHSRCRNRSARMFCFHSAASSVMWISHRSIA